MEQLVIVRSDATDHFTASVVGVPEVSAEGKTEEEAIARVKQALRRLVRVGEIVSIDVPVNGQSNPWLDGFGRSANDPDFPRIRKNYSARGPRKMPNDSVVRLLTFPPEPLVC